jgi:hypothetical protein
MVHGKNVKNRGLPYPTGFFNTKLFFIRTDKKYHDHHGRRIKIRYQNENINAV